MYLSLCALHRHQSRRRGPRTALRFRACGRYRDVTWTDYRRHADNVASGLIGLGVRPGDRVGILSENRWEWLAADHAMLSCGAATVPLHAPLSAAQVAYQLGHSGARGLFVSTQEQTDKVLQVLEDLPDLEFLVSFEAVDVGRSRLTYSTWDGLRHRGHQNGDAGRTEIARREADLDQDSLATIIYTSGTTGNPKGVMLTHGNLLSNALSTGTISLVSAQDVLMSWLPYSHIYARTVDHYLTTETGTIVALAASVDTLVDDLKSIKPAWITSVPRFYEKIWSSVSQLDPDSRRIQLHAIFGPNMTQLCSGGAPLPQHVCLGFFEAGLPLLEGYGLTETSPVISFNSLNDYRIGSVGLALPGVDVRIAADGEILTRGPHVMPGYWENADATRQAIVEGWFHTGDIGRLDDDGYLFITGRKKDLIITSGGKNIASSEIERLLVSDPYIDQAVVYGDGRPFISAMLVPDFEALATVEAGRDLSPTGDYLKQTALLTFFQERVTMALESVGHTERVKRFIVLARPFDLEAEELTATLKVRRQFLIEKHKHALAELYQRSAAD